MAEMFLENLLPDSEQVQDCADDDLETAGASAGLGASYKSLARGMKKSEVRVRRASLWRLPDFRILDRDAPFFQSTGTWAITRVKAISESKGRKYVDDADATSEIRRLLAQDLYHLFLDCSFRWQLLAFLVVYLLSFSFFAVLFFLAEEPCGLKLQYSFVRAYMLSVETMMTIGYGVSDPYMNGCWQGPVIITTQSLLNLLLSACLIGIIFQTLATPQSRANTIVFSDKAVIRCIDGAHYLMFRVADLRFSSALIEPHIRVYCCHMSHDRTMKFEMTPMRLQSPDDELGAPLAPSLPNLIVHRIDAWSPLAPKSGGEQRSIGRLSQISEASRQSLRSEASAEWGAGYKVRREKDHMREYAWPSTQQRQVNCETGSRNCCYCPTCGEAFGTAALLKLHCKYAAHSDKASGLPAEACHFELTEDDLRPISHNEPAREDIESHLEQGYFEIVVLVEGVEPTTAATLQARHSYAIRGSHGGDIEWDRAFVECVRCKRGGTEGSFKGSAHRRDRGLVVDIGCFHTTAPVDDGIDLRVAPVFAHKNYGGS